MSGVPCNCYLSLGGVGYLTVSIHIREWGAVQHRHRWTVGSAKFQFTFVSGVPCNAMTASSISWASWFQFTFVSGVPCNIGHADAQPDGLVSFNSHS